MNFPSDDKDRRARVISMKLSLFQVRPCSHKGSSGFTLLELIIVLLLIGLITGLVMVSLTTALPSTRFRSEVRKLGSLMIYAKNRAEYLNQEKEVILDLEKREARFEGKTRAAFADGTEIYIIDHLEGEIREGLYRIVFSPGGGSPGSVIVLTRKGRRMEIQLDPLTGGVIVKAGQKG
jgi:type II secretion system protein H